MSALMAGATFALMAVTGTGESSKLSTHKDAISCVKARVVALPQRPDGVDYWCVLARKTPDQNKLGYTVSKEELARLEELRK